MASPQVRQRGTTKRPLTPNPDSPAIMNGKVKVEETWEALKEGSKETVKHDWDHKIAFTIFTVLGFLTRFWGISHPDQVVFDEVHFGKVCCER